MPMRVAVLAALVLLSQTAARQTAAPHDVRDARFRSEALQREMPYRVLLPAGYDRSTGRYPVLYLLHGLDGSHTDWTERTRLAAHAAGRGLIIVTPEGGNSWYVNWHEGKNERWEDYVVRDLVAEIDARYRTQPRAETRWIAGLSMGGYGAVRLALKYPDVFALGASFSGAFDIAARDTFGWTDTLRAEFASAFGPAGGAHRAAHDLLLAVRNADLRRQPLLYFDCGTDDAFLPANRALAQALRERGFAYFYEEHPGAHNWTYWNGRIAEFLRKFRM